MKLRKKITECGFPEKFVVRIIEEEWISPIETDYLDEEDMARIRLIQELKEDFGVNDEGVPIILHLIDQINLLRLELIRRNDTSSG